MLLIVARDCAGGRVPDIPFTCLTGVIGGPGVSLKATLPHIEAYPARPMLLPYILVGHDFKATSGRVCGP